MRDALAGVVFAATDIPQALGYTRIAGMPVVTGLYALLLPLLAFATFGSSRYLVVAADSATAAILRSGLNGMAPVVQRDDTSRWRVSSHCSPLYFCCSPACSSSASSPTFSPETVLVGFLTGVGFQVGISVLGQMVGVPTDSHKTLVQLYRSLPQASSGPSAHAVRHHHRSSPFVFASPPIRPQIPRLTCWLSSVQRQSAQPGTSPDEASRPSDRSSAVCRISEFPDVHWSDILPMASVAGFLRRHDSCPERRDLAHLRRRVTTRGSTPIRTSVGLSAANAAAAFSGTFVVNGSPTQTAMRRRRRQPEPDRPGHRGRNRRARSALSHRSRCNIFPSASSAHWSFSSHST